MPWKLATVIWSQQRSPLIATWTSSGLFVTPVPEQANPSSIYTYICSAGVIWGGRQGSQRL
jgi:hypothetical protein